MLLVSLWATGVRTLPGPVLTVLCGAGRLWRHLAGPRRPSCLLGLTGVGAGAVGPRAGCCRLHFTRPEDLRSPLRPEGPPARGRRVAV